MLKKKKRQTVAHNLWGPVGQKTKGSFLDLAGVCHLCAEFPLTLPALVWNRFELEMVSAGGE